MAGRPQAVSVSSVASTSAHSFKSPAHTQSSLPQLRAPSSSWSQRTASITALSHQADLDASLDPDELFTKHTIGEVRGVQQRLRADADAKQEELRLMVGERYRDLLQASTSIIAIAESSQNVLHALEDMRSSIPPRGSQQIRLSRHASMSGKDDSQLKVLQSLAAHMKLLLDTPEHLWRLIERKKYLYAGWLFLLARVIHRALVRDDVEDEDNWRLHGIEITEQFPLVQRQWDTVSQFRAQITYKATLSLREATSSVEDICSVLLTLHLLESRPLFDTLSTFLAQRSKTLQIALSRGSRLPPNGQSSQIPNGSASAKSRKLVVRGVREAIQSVLEIISSTVHAARRIFQDPNPEERSLMGRILDFIQSDSPTPSTSSLPPELQMSTQHLLSTLQSASHFQLLPQTIRSYKPYIDLTSAASFISPTHISDLLEKWLQKALHDLQIAARTWFSDLHALREVWAVRVWLRKWVASSTELENGERTLLSLVFDTLVREQATVIWKAALDDTADILRAELSSALSALAQQTSGGLLDASPVEYLFQAPASSSFEPGSGSSGLSTQFRQYGAALRRQISGRTPLVDTVMTAIESRADALRKDFHAISKAEGHDQSTLDWLVEAYRPHANRVCNAIVEDISSSVEGIPDDSDTCVSTVAFLARVTEELSTSSFLSNICGTASTNTGFQEKIHAIHVEALSRWQRAVVGRIVDRYQQGIAFASPGDAASSVPSHPSTPMIDALFALSRSIHNLGLLHGPLHEANAAQTCFRQFTSSLLEALDSTPLAESVMPIVSCDLRFLLKLVERQGPDWTELSVSLGKKAKELDHDVASISPDGLANDTLWEDLLRAQLLLAPVLSEVAPLPAKDGKLSALLPLGNPVVEQKAQPAMDLAKSGPRFGLLLVGSTAVR